MRRLLVKIKSIRDKGKLYLNRFGAKKRFKKLKNKEFTIISNNCYAGLKYENLNLPFMSPTIGLYFFAADYIKFISNLKYYIQDCTLKIINASESKYYSILQKRGHDKKIIGLLGDVEIVFLHYSTEEEVIEKWNKRCDRIVWDKIIYKFNDQNLCDYEHLKAFNDLKLKNKICFTSKKYGEFPEFIQIKKYKNSNYVKDDVFFNNKYLNFVKYANNINFPKDKIRIFHVFNKMHMGGAETMIMNHYRCLDNTKYHFNFIVNHHGPYDEEILKLGGKIYYIPEYKIINHFKYKSELKKIFSQNLNADILHVHTKGFSSIILGFAKKIGLTTISHCHSVSNGKSLASLLKRIIEYRIRFFADYYFACSKEAAKWLYGGKRASSDKCYIINNAIDTKKFKYSIENRNLIRSKYDIDEDTLVIGQVGRLVPVKNYMFSIDLLAEILPKNNNVIMMFCGDGYQKEELQAYAVSKSVEKKIIFVDQTKDIFLYYSAFDMLILPSIHESLGMTLIEGQFAGLYCIASEGVSKDSKISENIDYMPLLVKQWAQIIVNKDLERKMSLNDNAKKFDVVSNTRLLQKIYIYILKNKEG